MRDAPQDRELGGIRLGRPRVQLLKIRGQLTADSGSHDGKKRESPAACLGRERDVVQGLLPVSPDAAEGFYRLVDADYERRALISCMKANAVLTMITAMIATATTAIPPPRRASPHPQQQRQRMRELSRQIPGTATRPADAVRSGRNEPAAVPPPERNSGTAISLTQHPCVGDGPAVAARSRARVASSIRFCVTVPGLATRPA
ncbi:hypothetical protein ACFVRD_36400 [Streptomyces sp. NPDC057908]|uniref:hypothetical protein n=1 Tax=Streptomyces sp. NPDC057908 TaxID=3346276 RepID=UPI0036E05250